MNGACILLTSVGVVEVGSRVAGDPLVSEGVARSYGALGDEGNPVVVLGTPLVDTVPVNRCFQPLHLVVQIYHHFVSLADLRQLYGLKQFFYNISSFL